MLPPVARQVAGVVDYDALAALRDLRQTRDVAREEIAVVLDLHLNPELLPVLGHRPNAMRADREQLDRSCGFQLLLVELGEIRNQQVVAEAADRIARAALLFQHAPRHAEEVQDL